MIGFWPVLVREVRERRSILIAGVVLGLLPVIVGLIPAVTRIGGADIRDNLVLVLGLAFPTAVALGLGASVIGRDVTERRLGFYFARPISGLALWAGKMGAALILIGTSALLVSLPGLLVGADDLLARALWSNERVLTNPFAYVGLPLSVLLVLIAAAAHAGTTMLRSRSGLLPLDLGILVATVFALGLVAWRIVSVGANSMFLPLAPAVLVVLLVALLAAGALQVAAGRSDSRRGHLFMSATLWGLLLSGAVGLHLALSWAFGATPSDVALGSFTSVIAAPRGSYFALVSYESERLGYWPAFLVDARTGGFVALGAAESMSQIAFAPDGRHAAWIRLGRHKTLCSADLDAAAPRLSTAPLTSLSEAEDYSSVLALSANGERLLQRAAGTVRTFETESGRLVAQSAILGVSQGSFDSTERVRLYRQLETSRPGAGIAILDWNLRTGQVAETGRIEDAVGISGLREGRLLVPTTRGGLALHDAESGRLLRRLLPADVDGPLFRLSAIWSRFLADARVASITTDKDGARLRVFSSGGDPLLSVVVSRSNRVVLGGESAPGELLIFDWLDTASAAYFIDAATGEVRVREDGIRPVIWNWRGSDPQRLGTPGSLETRLFIGPDGKLVDRDPATGARRVVIQGHKPQREQVSR